MRRNLNIYFLTLILPVAAASAANFPLSPYPNQLETRDGVFQVGPRVHIEVVGGAEEDRFAASLLSDELASIDRVTSDDKKDAPVITLARSDSPEGTRLLQKYSMRLPAQGGEEAYVLVIDSSEACVIAKSGAGIFYGVETLRQLFHPLSVPTASLTPSAASATPDQPRPPQPHPPGAEAPAVRIVDWPAMRWRGVSIDISRGPIPTLASLKRDIALLAEYKINVLSPYMENAYAYPSLPGLAAPGGALTPDEARELVEYAAKFHITVIPEQESFGHLHLELQQERLQDLAEMPYGNVLSPDAPGSFDLISKMFGDLTQIFPAPLVHIGADETIELGEGRTKDEVTAQGYGKVYIDYLRKIEETLAPYRRKFLFWGDMGLRHPELLRELPHDMVAVVWDYNVEPSYAKEIRPFHEAGLETWVAPGVSNWSRIYPNFNAALANIRQLVADGKGLGSTGVLNTTWMDDGEGMVNFAWFGLAYGAAQSWQKTVDDDEFKASWDWTFYRADDHHFADQVKKLSGIHDALTQAVNTDGKDYLTWRDALSPDGQTLYTKMEPAAHQIRLTAEDVLIDLPTNWNLARRNGDLLIYTEFAARRFDYLGQKAIYAKYISDLYTQAQSQSTDSTAVHQALSRARDLMDDMGHQTIALRDEYQKLWTGENTPYYLGNILARYDREAARWEVEADRLSQIRRDYDQRTLPPLIAPGLSK